MSKFLRLFLLFSSPIIIGMILLEILLRNIPNDYTFKRKYLDAYSNDIEVLFLGSSHIYFGINPEFIKVKSFNSAHMSQSLNFDLSILEKYGDNWNSLKYIVIPIDYFSIYMTLEDGIENWRAKNYSIYYNIATNQSYWNNFEIFNSKLPANLSKAKQYIFNKKNDITCNQFGFGTTYSSKYKNDLIETGKTAAKRHTVDTENNTLFSKNIQTIRSIIEFSKRKNIRIVFITCPAFITYTKNLMPVQLNNTINAIKKLSSKNINTYYFNFLCDTSFLANDYFDADHLNEIGAKKLTLKVDSMINSIESTTDNRQ